MGAWLDQVAVVLLDATLAAMTLLGLTASVMIGCRQPARRCALARGALLGSLLIVPLVSLGVGPKFALLDPLRQVAPPGAKRDALEALDRPRALVRNELGLSRESARWLPRAAVIVYAAGLGANLGLLGLSLAAASWVVRRSSEPKDSTRALFQSLCRGGRPPRLRTLRRLARPMAVGVVRPTILVPAELEADASREGLRLGLLHELVHARRVDPAFTLIGGLAGAVWFFLPPVWWLRAQMRLDQEFLADHDASTDFGAFGRYASSLIDLAQPDQPSDRRSTSKPSGSSALFLRVLMLVRCPFPVERRPPRWWRWSLPPAVVCATVLASGLTLRAPATADAARAIPAVTNSDHGQFLLGRLSVDRPPIRPDGTPLPYALPARLPDRFVLTLDIWSDTAGLADLRVVGLALASHERPNPTPDGWHSVRVRRTDDLSLDVDGLSIPPPTPLPLAGESLTLQASPGRSLLIRNLRLVW